MERERREYLTHGKRRKRLGITRGEKGIKKREKSNQERKEDQEGKRKIEAKVREEDFSPGRGKEE